MCPLRNGCGDPFGGAASSTCCVPGRLVWPIFAVIVASAALRGWIEIQCRIAVSYSAECPHRADPHVGDPHPLFVFGASESASCTYTVMRSEPVPRPTGSGRWRYRANRTKSTTLTPAERPEPEAGHEHPPPTIGRCSCRSPSVPGSGPQRLAGIRFVVGVSAVRARSVPGPSGAIPDQPHELGQ